MIKARAACAPPPGHPRRAFACRGWPMARSLGRTGARWRRARANVLAVSDVCEWCGHPGAGDVDHEPALAVLEAMGIDPCDERYLRPMHGSLSRCSHCGLCCNQVKGNRTDVRPVPRTLRAW